MTGLMTGLVMTAFDEGICRPLLVAGGGGRRLLDGEGEVCKGGCRD